MSTVDTITITADQVREGDTIHLSCGISGVVTGLPEWEQIEPEDDFQVGTITCETFGAFVFTTDEMRVTR